MGLINYVRGKLDSWAESRALSIQQLRVIRAGGSIVPSTAGVTITNESALSIMAVYSAINRIASDLGSLPLQTMQRGPNNTRSPVTAIPQYKLCYFRASKEVPAQRFRQTMMAHTLSWGNSYAEIERSLAGDPLALHLVHPRYVEPSRDENGTLLYRVRNVNLPQNRQLNKTVPAENMLHFAGISPDGIVGWSPIQLARQGLGTAMAQDLYGGAYFGNNARASGFLKHPSKLTPEAASNMRESFEKVHRGPENAWRVGILEGAWEWIPISIPPQDSQYIEARKFSILEIARLFSIPPHKIGDYSSAHYNNIEAANLDYISTTLWSWAVMIESEYNTKLFSEAEQAKYFCEHDFRALLRGDLLARSAFIEKMIHSGVYSINDGRGMEGQNGIGPEGDLHWLQGAMAPITILATGQQFAAKLGDGKLGDGKRFLLDTEHTNGYH